MKPKHGSLLAVVLMAITIALASWYEVERPKLFAGQSNMAPLKPLSDISVPDKAELAQIDTLERKMHLLATPPLFRKGEADLSGFGYVPLTRQDSGYEKGGTGSLDKSQRVTLAFDGKIKRYCAIGGRLYTEGDTLPDGEIIEKIESTRVLIARDTLKQWLMVEPLLNTALSDKHLQGDDG